MSKSLGDGDGQEQDVRRTNARLFIDGLIVTRTQVRTSDRLTTFDSAWVMAEAIRVEKIWHCLRRL